MNRRSLCTVVAMMSITIGAYAKPGYADARAIYDQIGGTLSKGLLWEKKSPQERRQAVVMATALRDRASKSMGPQSQCAQAAEMHLNLVMNMNVIASAGQGVGKVSTFQLLGMLGEAEALGERKAACYDEVEALDALAEKKP